MMLLAQANKAWTRIKLWRTLSIQRAELANMSDEMLRDIGISRAEAEFEAHRPFWDTKQHEEVPSGKKANHPALKLHYN